MKAFVVVGDVMMDVTATIAGPIALGSDTSARISLQAGGSAANTARWLASVGHSARLLGCIGDDALGEMALRALVRAGVQPMLVVREARTGTCVVIVEPTGERTMLPDAGANTLLTPGDLLSDAFTGNGHLHMSGYTLLRPATREAGIAACLLARAAGMTISLDAASTAPIMEQPGAFDEAYPLVDLLLANSEEALALTGASSAEQAAGMLADRVGTVVVKAGAEGAIGVHKGLAHLAPAVGCAVADTTGAGDAFAAGLLGAWTQGAPLAAALAKGNQLAAVAVSRVGAGPPTDEGQE